MSEIATMQRCYPNESIEYRSQRDALLRAEEVWPLWNMFDFLPEGRGTTWNPRSSYEEKVPLGRAR